MKDSSKKIKIEYAKISWLSLRGVLLETGMVISISILFALFLGGFNWLIQQALGNLLAK